MESVRVFDYSARDDMRAYTSTVEFMRSRSMTVRLFDLAPLRFDLSGGRPAIADFAAKCEAMLREPPIVDEDSP